MNHFGFYGHHPFGMGPFGGRHGHHGRPHHHMEESWHGRPHWGHHHGHHPETERHHLIVKDQKAAEELGRILKDFFEKKPKDQEAKDQQGKVTEDSPSSSSSSEEETPYGYCRKWRKGGREMKHGRCGKKGRSHHRGERSSGEEKKRKHHRRHGRYGEEPKRRCVIVLELFDDEQEKVGVGEENNVNETIEIMDDGPKGNETMQEGESSEIRKSMENLNIVKE